MRFSEPHYTGQPQTSEALKFQLAQAMFEAWPAEMPLDEFSIRLLNGSASELANTIKLNELTEF